MLGGRALNRSDIFDFGLELLEGCWHMYNATPTGISPEGTIPFPLKPVLIGECGSGKVMIPSMNHIPKFQEKN